MKLQFLALLALCSSSATAALLPAPLFTAQQLPQPWADLPPSSAILERANGLLHCKLDVGLDDELTLRIEEFDGSSELRARSGATLVELPGLSFPLVGGLDVAELPERGLVVSATFAVGASHHLRLWRLARTPDGGYRVASSAMFDRARLELRTPATPAGEVELFESPRALVGPFGVALFVAAHPTERPVTSSERAIVRLALSPDLSRIEAANFITHGCDPRLSADDSGLVLSVRTPADSFEEVNLAPLALLRSSDGRAWTALESSNPAPRVEARYALIGAGERMWAASSTPDAPGESRLWQFDSLEREWSERGSVLAAQVHSAARAPALWLSSRALRGQRPLIVFEAAGGLASK